MFKITIEGDTPAALGEQLLALGRMFQNDAINKGDDAAREELQAKRTAAKAKPAKPVEPTPEPEPANDDVDRELMAEVPPAPSTANSVVDAGTGQPIAAPVATKKVTMDDVRASATELAGKDTPKLKELITKHGGTKLSDIPPSNLPGFYGDVLEAIG